MAATGRLFSETKRCHLKGGQGARGKNSFFFFPKEALVEQQAAPGFVSSHLNLKKAQILPLKGARLPATARRCLPLGFSRDPAALSYQVAAVQANVPCPMLAQPLKANLGQTACDL